METNNVLIPLGAGIIIGLGSLLLLIELWPLVILGGATYMILKGIDQNHTKEA